MGIVKLLGLHSLDDQTQLTHGYSARLSSKSTYYIDQVRTNYGKFNIHCMHLATWRLGWQAPLVTFHKSLALNDINLWYFIYLVIMCDHRQNFIEYGAYLSCTMSNCYLQLWIHLPGRGGLGGSRDGLGGIKLCRL